MALISSAPVLASRFCSEALLGAENRQSKRKRSRPIKPLAWLAWCARLYVQVNRRAEGHASSSSATWMLADGSLAPVKPGGEAIKAKRDAINSSKVLIWLFCSASDDCKKVKTFILVCSVEPSRLTSSFASSPLTCKILLFAAGRFA